MIRNALLIATVLFVSPAHSATPSPAASDEIAALLMRLKASGCQFKRNSTWHSADYLSTNANKDYNTLDTNLLTLTVTSHGNFAYNNLVNMSQGEGFRYDGGSNLVSGFGLMCGTDMFHLSDNLYSIVSPVDSDFVADNYVLELTPAPVGDQCLYSQYSDRGADSASQMHISINQWSYAWNTPEDENFILVKYQIINDSIAALNNFYVGLFADYDIVNSAENRCWYDPSLNLIVATTTDSVAYAATALLSPYTSRYYAADMDGFNSSIALTDGFSENEKFSMLSTNRLYAGTDIDGNDVSACVGSGPFSIAPYDTLEITFAIIAGSSMSEIEEGYQRAKVRYLDPNLQIEAEISDKIFLFPNPATESINYSIAGESSHYAVFIRDLAGKLCFSGNGYEKEGRLDVSFLHPGVYSVMFVDGKFCHVMNFTIVR